MRIGFVPEAERSEDKALSLGEVVTQGEIYEEEDPDPIIYVGLRLGPWKVEWRIA